MTRLALSSLVMLFAACAPPGVQYAPTNPRPGPVTPRPAQEVAILFSPPACPYVEVGFIETTAPTLQGDWTIPEKFEAMRAEAAVHGADALLMISHTDAAAGGHHSSVASHNYAGVAINFTDDACGSPCGTSCAR